MNAPPKPDSPRLSVPIVVLVVLSLPIGAYLSGYVYARATHRLVHYSGGFIARPDAIHGIGWTTWELAFAPISWLEEAVRGVVDPSW